MKKIVPDTIARQMASVDLPSQINAGSDEFVTAVIEAKNVNANTLSIVLRPLIPAVGRAAGRGRAPMRCTSPTAPATWRASRR